jgi:tyrosinase
MAALNYPITGAPLPTPSTNDGSVPLRRELRDLQQNFPDQFNLYLLGLQAFHTTLPETNDLSYYGIAGIHGRPYRPWGGVEGDDPDGWQGYCTHTSILFAPWHRPYLALFEQVLYGLIQQIASSFPDSSRARYEQAAASFRIPYWDWAAQPAAGDYFPNAVGKSATISVITPQSDGKQVPIDNPLYTYKFNPLNPVEGDFAPGIDSEWQNTLRYPTSTSSAKAKSQDNLVFDAMQSQFGSLQSNVYLIMTDPNYQDFAAFSNHQWAPDAPGTYGSLEDVHNDIHGEVGGNGGHMTDLDYSAFDPVFWLHHANVDRLFAIWQALNPTSYTISEPAGDGTFTITPETTETATTALAPFKDASGTKYWNSTGVRSTETFNYAYPETQRWLFASDDQYTTSVQTAVQQLYGGVSNQFLGDQTLNLMAASVPPVRKATNGSHNGTQKKPNVIQKVIGSVFKSQSTDGATDDNNGDLSREINFEDEIASNQPAPVQAKPEAYTEYIANILAPKHALEQAYRVHIFLGEFDGSTSTWHTQDALVGTFVVLGKPQGTECGKCRKDKEREVMITGTIPLTSALLKEYNAGNLGGMDKENVLPWLTKNLHWRITLADGTEKAREEVPGLKVSVVTTEVRLPPGGFPQFSGVYEVHPEVTQGRPAGHNSGDRI